MTSENDRSTSETPTQATETVTPQYAMVEIFGHRQHYAEIRDIDIAGGKLLEVRDIDTEKVHMYGAGAIFSITPLSQAEVDAHTAAMKRRREQEEKWALDREGRRQALLAAPAQDDEDPF